MAPRTDEDEQVRRACRGDPEALEALVRRHYRPVWRTLWRFTRDRDETDALTQETFLKAIGKLSSFRGEASLRSWITSVGIHLALNEKRRRRPRPVGEPRGPAGTPSPEGEAGDRERAARVHEAVDALPDDLSAAIVLTAFAGYTHQEAAVVLGCAEGTVSWRVHEARKRLREVLNDVVG